MIGGLILVLIISSVTLYLESIERRDNRRRKERLSAWYREHGGGE